MDRKFIQPEALVKEHWITCEIAEYRNDGVVVELCSGRFDGCFIFISFELWFHLRRRGSIQ